MCTEEKDQQLQTLIVSNSIVFLYSMSASDYVRPNYNVVLDRYASVYIYIRIH